MRELYLCDDLRSSRRPARWSSRSQHVVVIIGENHRPHAKKAEQLKASVTKTYTLSPTITGAYTTLPQPNTTYVATGCDGQAANTPDKRFPANLPNGEIENPNPKPGTNNNYTQDGYGSSTKANTGGSYSECADRSQPGVGAVFDYLDTLPYQVLDNCQPGRYYLLNNYNPGYTVTGARQTAPYTVPPQESDYVTIGQALSAKNISWGYFGEGYNNGKPTPGYCGICDPMQYSSAIMTNPALRANTQLDSSNFISEAEAGTLPAVSFLKPADDDGHPGYSSLYAFENFVARAVAAVQSNTAE
jgi:hypothetical protein